MHDLIQIDYNPFSESPEIEKLCPTNEPQKEIWLSCTIGGADANRSYNESVTLRMSGALDVACLRRAIEELVARHEALRCTVSPDGESLIVYKNMQVVFEVADLRNDTGEEQKEQFDAFLKRLALTELDLKNGPLFSAFLHQFSETEFALTLLKHHIIADGWSSGIILEDISGLYNALVKQEQPSLAPAYQLSDYNETQRSFAKTKAFQATQQYWLDTYAGNVPVLNLPADQPRGVPRTYSGDRIDQVLPVDRVARLKDLGARAGTSLVTTLLAAFEIFLYKVTRQRDIVVGLPSSGQVASELADVVGHCVNLLPLRTRVMPEQSFSDYLKKRKGEVLDAYEHQRITFGELIKKLYIQRDASRIPLAPVMFNIDMGMDSAVKFDGLTHELISNPRAFENFEIFLNITGSEEKLVLEWSYNTDLFRPSTIARFNEQYHLLLNDILERPSATIEQLSGIVNKGLLVKGTAIEVPAELTLNKLVADAVHRYPDKIAIRFGDASLTYAQLDEEVAWLSAYLTGCGMAAGDIVGVSVNRSLEMVVSFLAILKSGMSYLPLDPTYPPDRVEYMLRDSGAKLLLTSQEHKGRHADVVPVQAVEDIWPQLGRKPQAAPQVFVTGATGAYLLYTSGSTGKPKGVKVTHRNLVNFLLSMQAAPGITATDKLLAVTSMSFDIAGLEWYLPLISGAELVIADTDTTRDGRLMLDALRRYNVTMMQATPSGWQMLLDAGWEQQANLKMLCGGEALPLALAAKLLERGSELWNMYGPTETTIWSTVKQIARGEEPITIGLPIANTSVYIADETGSALPGNEIGEICIGGYGVASGYHNRETLTAERFITGDVAGEVYYRTGDLGKILENGEIICLGRIDHQVKIRGHRIELGEIEAELQGLDGIKECVVVAREDKPGDKRIVSYVTLEENAKENETTWKDRWDTLYEKGAENKQQLSGGETIDRNLLEHYTDRAELAQHAEEWLKVSVDRIKEIGAKSVYEIGSGAGQVLFEVAPFVERYIATDYAQTAIDSINERLSREGGKWGHVFAAAAPADDFSVLGDESADLVVINSVAQYFPDADYLLRVVQQATRAVKNGGCIFIGDMQGMSTLHMFHAMDHLSRVSDLATVGSFREVVEGRVRMEEEFVADPAFFYLLPRLVHAITGVDVQLRKGAGLNETTKYHYDVWLYVNRPIATAEVQQVYQWDETKDNAQLAAILSSAGGAVVEIKSIPNARTTKDHLLQQLLKVAIDTNVIAGIKDQVLRAEGGVFPGEVWQLAAAHHYRAHIRWATDGTDNRFDVVFLPGTSGIVVPPHPPVPNRNIYEHARTPLSLSEVYVSAERIGQWRDKLSAALPAYMVPEDIVVLKKIPLTPNGKTDRKALPAPAKKNAITEATRPLTPEEQLVADVWADALGRRIVNAADDFFQLGGHSLLAVKVMVALEKKTGRRLHITTLFEHPTVEQLASRLVTRERTSEWHSLVPIKTGGNKLPLFFVHGADLNVLLFKALSEYLDADQPVYGLQALGLNTETIIPESIEQIAEVYVQDMLKVQPDGPYALAGYSLGGFLAFEVAMALRKRGKEVTFLGIIDTYAGAHKPQNKIDKLRHEVNKVAFLTRSLVSNTQEALSYQLRVARNKIERLVNPGNDIPREVFTKYEGEIYQCYSNALDAYVLREADVKVTLFAVEKKLYYVDDPETLGWNHFALKGVSAHSVPGDHKTVLYPPNSEVLAKTLQKVLNEATRVVA